MRGDFTISLLGSQGIKLVCGCLEHLCGPQLSLAHAQSPKRLWVLPQPDELVEYDVITFATRRTLKVPHRLLEQPAYLSLNTTGQMVFLPPRNEQWASGEMAAAGDRVWFWDGHQAKEWKLKGPQTRGGTAGKPTVTD